MVGYNCILQTYHITAKLLILDAVKHGAEVDQKDIAASLPLTFLTHNVSSVLICNMIIFRAI